MKHGGKKMGLIKGESRGLVLGYNCQIKKDSDIYESLQVSLLDFDGQPAVEATEQLPKWMLIGLPRVDASKYPIGSEIEVEYKYNPEYDEFASVKIKNNRK